MLARIDLDHADLADDAERGVVPGERRRVDRGDAVLGECPVDARAGGFGREALAARGLLDSTLIVWGEFGRTPTINKDAGRDHWPRVNGALLAGGGLRMGQVIGATDSVAAYAKDQPIHYQDVLATIYHSLGIDPHTLVRDLADRPVPILPTSAQVVRQLV